MHIIRQLEGPGVFGPLAFREWFEMTLDILVWAQWMATKKLPMYRPKQLVMMLVKAVFRKSGGRDFCALRTTTNQRRVPLLAMERLGVGTSDPTSSAH